jgi:hypothetical protein
MKNTKGPWSAVATPSSLLHDIRYISGGNCEKIATIHIPADMSQEEALANARLIQRSPDILNALQEFCYAANSRGRLDPGGCDYNTETGFAYRNACELIEEITGER